MKHLLLRKFFLSFCFCLLTFGVQAQRITNQTTPVTSYSQNLVGNEDGIYRIESQKLIPLWTEGSVNKIVYADGWFFLTSKGIIFSKDLRNFESRNNGLPFSTIKKYDGNKIFFEQQVHPLKDVEFLSGDSRTLVTTTTREVFISRNAGLSWQSLGFSARTVGSKAVAVANLSSENNKNKLTVFMSHPIYGVAYIHPDDDSAKWIDIADGFETMPTLDHPDEISDILTVTETLADGTTKTDVYFTQSFLPRLYKLDWAEKKALLIGSETDPQNTWDSLIKVGSNLAFMSMDGIRFFSPKTNSFIAKTATVNNINNVLNSLKDIPFCVWLSPSITKETVAFGLSELWMARTSSLSGEYTEIANGKRSLYVPSSQVTTQDGINSFIKKLEENDLNSIVIDMKDDKGILRYSTKNALVAEKAHVSSYALDVEKFIKQFKEKNIYLIARLVVFKDANLYNYNEKEYAVWDSKTNNSWLGIKSYTEGQIDSYYDEHWVDPYSHEVWEYNVSIAKELIELGFDEIQFDYIRFPTDGYNLNDTEFRWQEEGMDKESAIVSFLAYARESIEAPIGVDIYGVNGWYRSGSRTGQDVELLAPYVDVISPMSYPSHFESYFLAYTPIVERPYRIYFYGTYRNAVIARNQVVVRPWLQSFYLSYSSYDEEYYGSNYVQRQVFGVRDATDTGYMYWNNVGRYDEVRPHIGSAEENLPYPWEKAERDEENNIPVFSGKQQ